MKGRILAFGMVVMITLNGLFALLPVMGESAQLARAVPGRGTQTVTAIEPNEALNNLDTAVVISGEGFETTPKVFLGEVELTEVTWVSETELSAVVPWGMDPGFYALTVENRAGETATLADAFTVTQGTSVWTSGGPYGGGIYSLDLGDEQGETVYATLGNIGVFRSRNGGNWWEMIFIENGYLNELLVDPTNPDRLYIAKQAHEKQGLYISEDGGDSWTAMTQPIPEVSPRVFLAFVNPHNGFLFGALRSDMDDPSCAMGCGLFRFDDKDQVWIRLEEDGLLNENTGVTAVEFDPLDSDMMYAGLVGGLVLKSINGGQTWSVHSQTPLSYIFGLVVNPVGNELWVSSPGGRLPGGLYRYDGNEWISMYTSSRLFTWVNHLIFDPNAPDVNNQNVWIAAGDDGLFRSPNGGADWEMISPIRSEAIALNPAFSQTIYSGNNEGVSKTNDGGLTWQTINEGLTGIVPGYMGISPHDPAVIFGVADSMGIFGSRNGGETWQRRTVSTFGPIVVDPDNPQHVVNADYNTLRIADDGWNFNRELPIPMPPGMAPENYSALPNALIARPGQWVMGVGYNSRLLPYFNYEGGGGIYISENGENWELITTHLECPPTSIAFDPVDENILYASTSGMRGGVNCGESTFLRSNDSGQTWHPSTNGIPPDIGGGIIAIEPTPPHRIYLASGSYMGVSMDQAVNWQETISPTNSYIRSLLYLEGEPSIFYAGTGEGLFRSLDGAQTWQRAHGALGQFETWSLAGAVTVDGRHIVYAATIRGVLKFELPLFNDVPEGYWAENYIYWLYAAGITIGCSQVPPLYCPEQNVTRAEMAVFLERGINEPGYVPPQGTGTLFADVPITYWAVNWIEQLFNDGITIGCDTNPLRYCPNQSVTRAEMAAFLLRAKYGAGYTPPVVTESAFVDVPLTHWAVNWVAKLAADGITTGVTATQFDPEGYVTRAQMAAFLVRTFELP